MNETAEEVLRLGFDLIELQEIRWKGKGSLIRDPTHCCDGIQRMKSDVE